MPSGDVLFRIVHAVIQLLGAPQRVAVVEFEQIHAAAGVDVAAGVDLQR